MFFVNGFQIVNLGKQFKRILLMAEWGNFLRSKNKYNDILSLAGWCSFLAMMGCDQG